MKECGLDTGDHLACRNVEFCDITSQDGWATAKMEAAMDSQVETAADLHMLIDSLGAG